MFREVNAPKIVYFLHGLDADLDILWTELLDPYDLEVGLAAISDQADSLPGFETCTYAAQASAGRGDVHGVSEPRAVAEGNLHRQNHFPARIDAALLHATLLLFLREKWESY